MKIRDAKPEELVRPAQAKELSPRQKVAQEREAKFRKLLESLSDPAQIKAIEPEKDEKLSTLRASLTKVLQGDHRGAHLAVKSGIIYVSLGLKGSIILITPPGDTRGSSRQACPFDRLAFGSSSGPAVFGSRRARPSAVLDVVAPRRSERRRP